MTTVLEISASQRDVDCMVALKLTPLTLSPEKPRNSISLRTLDGSRDNI